MEIIKMIQTSQTVQAIAIAIFIIIIAAICIVIARKNVRTYEINDDTIRSLYLDNKSK
jgi:hypothetical protein